MFCTYKEEAVAMLPHFKLALERAKKCQKKGGGPLEIQDLRREIALLKKHIKIRERYIGA